MLLKFTIDGVIKYLNLEASTLHGMETTEAKDFLQDPIIIILILWEMVQTFGQGGFISHNNNS